MQTTPPIDSANNASLEPVIPSDKKIRQVKRSVAIVMPEIGLLEDPISPVRRLDTITNKNPKNKTSADPPMAPQSPTCGAKNHAKSPANTNTPPATTMGGRSFSVLGVSKGPPFARAWPSFLVPMPKVEKMAPNMVGKVLIKLNMPAAATQPAPMNRR